MSDTATFLYYLSAKCVTCGVTWLRWLTTISPELFTHMAIRALRLYSPFHRAHWNSDISTAPLVVPPFLTLGPKFSTVSKREPGALLFQEQVSGFSTSVSCHRHLPHSESRRTWALLWEVPSCELCGQRMFTAAAWQVVGDKSQAPTQKKHKNDNHSSWASSSNNHPSPYRCPCLPGCRP